MTNAASSTGPGNLNPKGQIPKAAEAAPAKEKVGTPTSTKLSREDTRTAIEDAMKLMARADGSAAAQAKLQEVLDGLK